MKSQESVLIEIREGRESQCLDGRDYSRLCDFFPAEQWGMLGFAIKKNAQPATPRPWIKEEVVKQLSCDVAFGFEKALGKRGISASLMNEVVRMWLWVLEDPLYTDDSRNWYPEYGLPLLKAVALRYGFPNPIGDDDGSEYRYSSEGEE